MRQAYLPFHSTITVHNFLSSASALAFVSYTFICTSIELETQHCSIASFKVNMQFHRNYPVEQQLQRQPAYQSQYGTTIYTPTVKTVSSDGYRVCCCLHFKSRRAICILGTIGYFLAPKIPDFKVTSIGMANSSEASRRDFAFESGTAQTPIGRIQINLEANLTITNSNPYNIYLKDVELTGTIDHYDLKIIRGHLSTLTMYRNGVTEAVFPLALQLRMDEAKYANATEAKSILDHVFERCGARNPADIQAIRINYEIKTKIAPFDFLGHIIKLKRNTSFRCPDAAKRMINDLKSFVFDQD
ncbi:hypothetical protein BDF22DRAFT_677174 [Syncephalis plumigaleata]|nr:hypothetical protein BDF22DRAFT_677174 [Syncephalis plumigaleata]